VLGGVPGGWHCTAAMCAAVTGARCTYVRRSSMKKWMLVFTAVVALAGGTLMAATIGNLNGQSCGDFTGTWHFVNNQVPAGSDAGQLTATFSSGDSCTVSASKVNGSTQHFNCIASGTLLSASTNLGGKLVLSDYTCETKEPPKCDPKTDPNCK
jgi:hypothetical protein